MKYDWDSTKNEWLKEERGISFEQIIFHLAHDDLWKVADHPDQTKYPGQKIYFVIMDNYVYLVPHKRVGNQILLKTIIPSRKATNVYQKELEKKDEI